MFIQNVLLQAWNTAHISTTTHNGMQWKLLNKWTSAHTSSHEPSEAKAHLCNKNSILSSKKIQPISSTEINCLMLFMEVTALYSDSHTELKYTMQGKIQLLNISYHRATLPSILSESLNC